MTDKEMIAKTSDLTTIGTRIRKLRKGCDMTQGELAAKVGVTTATINKYETGAVKELPRSRIELLARALRVSPGYLLGWTDDKSRNKLLQAPSLFCEPARISISPEKRKKIQEIANAQGVIVKETPSRTKHTISTSMSKEEKELLRIYNTLGVKDRMKLLQFAFSLEEGPK